MPLPADWPPLMVGRQLCGQAALRAGSSAAQAFLLCSLLDGWLTGSPMLPLLQAEVKLRGGAMDGRSVWLDYEDFSRWQGTFK